MRRRLWGASTRAGVCIAKSDADGYHEHCRIELALANRVGANRAAARR
jgi:hypothetical protein